MEKEENEEAQEKEKEDEVKVQVDLWSLENGLNYYNHVSPFM